MNESSGFKAFLIKGLVIVLVAIVFLFIGGAVTLGVLSAVNKISPSDLIRGNITNEEQAEAEKEADKVKESTKVEETSEESSKTIEEEKVEQGSSEAILKSFNSAISKIVEKVTPSVVNIRVTVQMQDIFGQIYEREGVGSGVIYTEDGYIITNNHVAGDADKLVVTLNDNREYPAKLVGADENTDVAVIKIEADNLQAATFDSIDNAKVGDIVIAVGSPFGLQQTVTMGVISAKGRDISVSQETLPMVNLIQTDAAINQGNSGGPLVNLGGKVIGINTLILSPSGASAGIGFAIPSDTVINIAEQIIEYGKARIPYIGIVMGENNTDISGVYIENVAKGYPAEKAGIKPGDIITEFDGVEVKNPLELIARILRHNVGDTVIAKIYRDDKYLNITLELTESPLTKNN